MNKVIVKAEVELGNEEMVVPETAIEEIIATLVGRCEVGFKEGTYQETIMDINGNSVGNITVTVK